MSGGIDAAALADEQLMELAVAGEEAAIGHLFERYHRQLYGYCLGWCGDPVAAEDLVQETFVRLLSYRASWRNGRPVGPWLWTIARNVCRTHRRHPVDGMEEAEGIEDPSAGPLRRHEGREAWRRLRGALARLADSEVELVLLARIAGLDSRSLAEHFETTPGAVRVRLHRLMRRLRDGLAAEEER